MTDDRRRDLARRLFLKLATRISREDGGRRIRRWRSCSRRPMLYALRFGE